MRRGPSGKVVCCICRKRLDRSAAVGLYGKSMHVEKCFALGLQKIGTALQVRDRFEFAVETAYKAGRAQ